MRVTIERLRTAIVVFTIVLVAAIGIFLGSAKYARKRLLRDLPARLGVEIQQSADSYTFSKSDKGRTIFTLHASKAVQYKGGGHATLHDVSITLYGPKGDRADSIHGAEFDYDPKSGVATAAGEVEIDLQAPAGSAQPAGSRPPGNISAAPAEAGAKPKGGEPGVGGEPAMIHVKTSGLMFDRNKGLATTHNLVEFRMPRGAGHATGASYDSQQGVLVLDSAVHLDSNSNGKAFSVEAAHAQIVRDSRQAFLLNAVSEYENQKTTSDEATVYFRPDGTAEHVDARGHVHIIGDGGQDLKAQIAKVLLDGHSQPQHADLSGGLFFVSNDKVHHLHGAAVEAKLQFGDASSLRHVQLLNAVSFVDQQVALPDEPNGSTTREIRAEQIDVEFAPGLPSAAGVTRQAMAQRVLATGKATVVLHTISSKHPQQNTTIGADTLLASIAHGNEITGLTGTGNTRVVDVAADGATETSTADNLTVSFAAVNGKRGSDPRGNDSQGRKAKNEAALPATQIHSAVQQGNVVITRTEASGSKQPASPLHLTARRAEYQAGDQVLHLDGSPHFNDGAVDLSSDLMEYQRGLGTATATGNVKATYLQRADDGGGTGRAGLGSLIFGAGGVQGGRGGPAHIVADSATMNRTSADPQGTPNAKANGNGDAVFRGHARLWQGTNSISAPVIELSRTKQSLRAHGETAGGTGERVNAVLATAADGQHGPSASHIQSRELAYSDSDRRATFLGSVVAQGAIGTIHSDQAVVYLAPSSKHTAVESSTSRASSNPAAPGDDQSPEKNSDSASSRGGPSAGQTPSQSQIDHIVATGHIILDQPGRRATGDKLTYSAADGNFTLTGTASAPPRLIDQVHGTVTGASLIFNSRDDSVSVSGGQSRAATDTRVRK